MKDYDLADRTRRFAELCRDFTNVIPRNSGNFEYAKQLIRSSGSQAANYIEANEALTKRDFIYRIKICVKETRESALWIRLCNTGTDSVSEERQRKLLMESQELRKIFGAILAKSS